MHHIATAVVGSGGGTPSFTNIPQNFKHLQLRVTIRGTRAGATNGDLSYIRFNGDFGVTYNSHSLSGNGTSASSGAYNTFGFMFLADSSLPDAGSTANIFGSQVWDILDYSSTTKFKIVRMSYGWDANGSGQVGIASGCWRDNSAITTISNMGVANSLAAEGTRVDLYGITYNPIGTGA
jgi:hypothetical protein